jgi:hypothetical protein
MGILSSSRYVSSNSGGTWIGAIVSFIPEDQLDDFFGQYIPPEKCTVETLSQLEPNSFAHTVATSSLTAQLLAKLVNPIHFKKDHREFWSRAVGHVFFEKNSLNNYDHLPTLKGEKYESRARMITDILPDEIVSNINVTASMATMPYPIVNVVATIGGDAKYTPVEFTPLYYGLPAVINVNDRKAAPVKGVVGGCLVEPHGFVVPMTRKHVQSVMDSLSKVTT